MRTSHNTAGRLAAVVGVSAVILTAGAFPAAASSGDVDVVNTETVQAYADATGKVQSKRIYEQLALTGTGTVDLANPVNTDGLRNLDGFGGFDVKDGDQMVDVKVDGSKNLRSVSNFKGDLPLDISVVYKLDGKEITPKSLVGKSGDLEVVYTVKNVTGRTETISFTDGQGGTVEKEADVIVPMVGSLTTGLPSNFRDVTSGQANMAGDGEGGTKLSFTMTLLAPLGSDTAVFGYTAKVTDAIAPDSSVSALPVNPLESPSFKTAGDSYKGGAATGEELAAGAAKIDSNLLKLRDGAGDLLAGLIKLRNGAQQLSDGLNDEAAPGAVKLADGAGKLADGTGQLKDGTSRLSAGTGDLKDGTTKLAAGTGKLDAGAGELSDGASFAAAKTGELAGGLSGLLDGMKQLRQGLQTLDVTVTPQIEASAGYQTLIGTLTKVITGIGDPSDLGAATPGDTSDDTIIGGINALKAGLNGQVAPGLQQIKGGLDDAVAASDGNPATPVGGLDELKAGINGLGAFCAYAPTSGGPPTPQQICQGTVASLTTGVDGSKTRLTAAAAGLGEILYGLTSVNANDPVTSVVEGLTRLSGALYNTAGCSPATPATCGVSQGLSLISQVGIPALVDGVLGAVSAGLLAKVGTETANCDPTKTLLCATGALAAGGGALSDGLGDLAAGAGKLAAGVGELDSGAGQLDAGATKLDDGAGQLDAGVTKLDDGAGQLSDGAGKLADGLSSAASGSSQIADGLVTAAGGAPKIVDGAGRLSTEGTSKLVTAGQETAQKYGEQYALLVAGAKRAQNEKMVVGAPADAAGLAAYSYEIKGENGEGNRNLMRGIAGLALLGAGGAVFGLRRRLI